MVTEIKMQVTPDLSKRVQEIVFANGGSWTCTGTNLSELDEPYICIDKNKQLYCEENKQNFESNKFEEISPYDFIASQGEQKWLPKYNEEALFSDDEEEWVKRKFVCYLQEQLLPYRVFPISNIDFGYRYCKPLPKQISFVQFLKDNNAYEIYMNNVKIENQRWYDIKYYIELYDLKKEPPTDWFFCAFNWRKQKENVNFWDKLNIKWLKLCKENDNIVWEQYND